MRKMRKAFVLVLVLVLAAFCGTLMASCGKKKSKACEHANATSQVIAAAMCTEAGTAAYSCPDCGKTWTETQNALGHSLNGGVVREEATCTEDGEKVFSCTRAGCNHTETEIIKAAGHSIRELREEATCTAAGYVITYCENCDDLYERASIKALNHEWDEGITEKGDCETASKVVKSCKHPGCTATLTEPGKAPGHDYEKVSSKCVEADCTHAGKDVFKCKNCTSEYEVTVNPKGHTITEHATCTSGETCDVCNEQIRPALGHDYEPEQHSATCTAGSYIEYTCRRSGCSQHYTENTGVAKGHNTAEAEWSIANYTHTGEGASSHCVAHYTALCPDCGASIERETTGEHVLTSSITQTATCSEGGTATYICSHCDISYTETTAINAEAHNWGAGKKSGDVTTYTCSHNTAHTKQTIDAKDSTTAKVSADTLKTAGEIELSSASIALDENAKTALEGKQNVEVKADSLAGEDLENVLADLGEDSNFVGDTVYNFTMKEEGAEDGFITNFGGKVTVRIPYELEAGEDPDSIVVWYIAENAGENKLTSMNAKYCVIDGKGYAVFETEHFSYYTVTRLTAEQRCAKLGHQERTISKAATCTAGGYEIVICTRCGVTISKTEYAATEHDWEEKTESVADCTHAGKTIYTCKNQGCNATYSVELPVLGHDWNIVSNPGNCTTPGTRVYTCTRSGCAETHTEPVPAPGHDYRFTKVAPTCISAGYNHYVCRVCEAEYKDNYTPTAEHVWNVAAATCKTAKYCTACGTVGEAKLEHVFENGVCKECGEGCEHNFITKKTVNPTCTTGGYTEKLCVNCDFITRTDVKPALGHDYNSNGVCTVCGAEKPRSETFWANMLEGISADKFTVTFRGIVISNLSTDVNTSETKELNKISQLNVASLTLGLDANGEICGSGNAKVAYDVFNSFTGKTETAVYDGKVSVKDGYVYVFVDTDKDMYVKISLNLVITEYFRLPVNYETLKTYIAWFKNDFVPVINALKAANISELDNAVEKIMTSMFGYTTGEYGYKFTFNYDFIDEFAQDLVDLGFTEFADKYLAKGICESFADKVSALMDKKVLEVLADCADRGLKLDDVYAAADSLMFIITGEEFDSKTYVEGLTVVGNKPLFQTTVSELACFVAANMGMEIDCTDPAQVAEFKSFVIETIEKYMAMAEEMPAYEFIGMLAEKAGSMLPGFGQGEVKPDYPGENPDEPVRPTEPDGKDDENVPAPENPDDKKDYGRSEENPEDKEGFDSAQMKEALAQAIEALKKHCSIIINTDSDGFVKNITVTLKKMPVGGYGTSEDGNGNRVEYVTTVDGTTVLAPEEGDVSADGTTVNAVENALPKFDQKIDFVPEDNATYDFTVDKNGNITGIYRASVSERRYKLETVVYNGIECYVYYVEVKVREIAYDFTQSSYAELTKNYCGDWDLYSLAGRRESVRSERQVRVEFVSVADGIVIETIEQGKTEIPADDGNIFDTLFSLYYNSKTKVLTAVNPHNFELDEKNSYKAEGCEGVGLRRYICSECGEVRDDYYTKGHGEETRKCELAEGATSCLGGVKVSFVCSDCGKTTHSYVERYHVDCIVRTISFGDYGSKCGGQIAVFGCACGATEERFEYNRENGGCELHEVARNGFETENGIRHEFTVYSCAVTDCGFTFVADEYIVPDKITCKCTRYVKLILGVDYTLDEEDTFWEKCFNGTLTGNGKYEIVSSLNYYYHDTEHVYEAIPERRVETAEGYKIISGHKDYDICRVCGTIIGKETTHTEYYDNTGKLLRYEDDGFSQYDGTKQTHYALYVSVGNEFLLKKSKEEIIDMETGETSRNEVSEYEYVLSGETVTGYTVTDTIIHNYVEEGRSEKQVHIMTYETYKGYNLIVSDRSEYYYDKESHWSEYTYVYPNADKCYREVTAITSDGEKRTYSETEHLALERGEHHDATCTQGGYILCSECNRSMPELSYVKGHNWTGENGNFVCSDCGLESKNDVDGLFILEDLTANQIYAEAGRYVVGYGVNRRWHGEPYYTDVYVDFKEELIFRVDSKEAGYMTYVLDLSIVYKDESGEDAEAVINHEMALNMGLFDLEAMRELHAQGYRKILINAEAVNAYIRDELGLNPEEVMLRLTVNPVGSGITNDYAITLDPYVNK